VASCDKSQIQLPNPKQWRAKERERESVSEGGSYIKGVAAASMREKASERICISRAHFYERLEN
jgi:hypothetical protein